MKHKSVVLTLAILIGLIVVAFGVVHAQQAAPSAPAANASSYPCMHGGMMGMMGQRGMGRMQGMTGMQQGMLDMRQRMMSMCPIMAPNTNVEVKSIDKGVTITITSNDAKTARRIQLTAEMMRLMHELRSQQ